MFRGVGTGGGGARGAKAPSQVFRIHKKCPFFQWQSSFCLREKCCSDCIFDSRILQSNICEFSWYLSAGWLNNDQPAWHALFACQPGLSEPEIGLEHDKWQNLHGARFMQKQLQTAFASVSRPQRPLIYDCIYFSFLPPPLLPPSPTFP
jgi:hypothetical protein